MDTFSEGRDEAGERRTEIQTSFIPVRVFILASSKENQILEREKLLFCSDPP